MDRLLPRRIQAPNMSDAVKKKLFVNLDMAGLTRSERLELAEVLLNKDVESFADLDTPDYSRLLDATIGWHYIETLRNP